MEKSVSPNQADFDARYISIREIADRLKLTTNAVVDAKNRGVLPDYVQVSGRGKPVYLWLREQVNPIVDEWEKCVVARRKLKSLKTQ